MAIILPQIADWNCPQCLILFSVGIPLQVVVAWETHPHREFPAMSTGITCRLVLQRA